MDYLVVAVIVFWVGVYLGWQANSRNVAFIHDVLASFLAFAALCVTGYTVFLVAVFGILAVWGR